MRRSEKGGYTTVLENLRFMVQIWCKDRHYDFVSNCMRYVRVRRTRTSATVLSLFEIASSYYKATK